MFSWFTGGDDKPAASAEAQAPGFHPITLPADTSANPYVAATTTTSNTTAPSPVVVAPLAPSVPITAPPTDTASTATPSSSFLFDGMELGKTRRRRVPAPSPTASSTALPPNNETAVDAAASANNLKDSSNSPKRNNNVNGGSNSSDLPDASSSCEAMRHRVERFYRHYNPAKLANIDAILEAYRGKEAQLFEELTQRYGPEPTSLSAAHLPQSVLSTTEAALHAGSAASESEVSAFRFLNAPAEPSGQGAEGEEEAKAEVDNGASKDTFPATELSEAAQFDGQRRVGGSAGGAVSASDTVTTPLQAQPNAGVESPANGIPKVTAAPSSAAAPQQPQEESQRCFSSSSSSSSSSDAETMEERQRRELRVSQGTLLEARAALAAVLEEAQAALAERQDAIAHIHKLEARIQECVRMEDYRRADAYSDEVLQFARQVRACDDVWRSLGRRVAAAQRQLDDAVRAVASVLRAHEVELLAAEEREKARVAAQMHVDDSDLRLREETVAVRQEDLRAKQRSADTRLAAAQAAQAAAQQKVDATLRTTRTQQEALAHEVSALDDQIAELKARLRQLETKRSAAQAQLSSVTEKIAAASAVHAGELDAAAKAVQSAELESQRLQQQWAATEDEEESIRKERQARHDAAAALLQELQDRQTEREAVHQRTRALEQMTIPASDQYWRSWQDIFSKRLQGGDVLFEIPAATRPEETATAAGPSALTKKTDLLKQLRELDGERQAEEELLRDAQRRLETCEARVAPLSAAKSAAVASKNFKAAQQCADELRVLQVSLEACQGDVELYGGQVRALDRTMERLRKELAAAEAETQRYAAVFKKEYGEMMRAFPTVSAARAAGEGASSPDYVQLPKDGQGHDELAEATQHLWAALQQEWKQCAGEEPSAAEHNPVSEAAAPTTVENPSPARPSSSISSSLSGSHAALNTIVESAPKTEGETAPDDSAADVAATGPSVEELKQQLGELQASLQDAIAREDYNECDVIQQQIEQLESQLSEVGGQS